MAHCVQFRGPNAQPQYLVGASESQQARQNIKQRVDTWAPTGTAPFGVLIARDEAELMVLLQRWARQRNGGVAATVTLNIS
jgi:hypothetical protein